MGKKKEEGKKTDLLNSEEMTKILVYGSLGLGCLSYTSDITIPSFITSTITTLSSLSISQMIVGLGVCLVTAIFTNEMIQDIIDKSKVGREKK